LLTVFPGSNTKVLFHRLRGFSEIRPDNWHLASICLHDGWPKRPDDEHLAIRGFTIALIDSTTQI
jgi:hypothetical protein